MAKPEHFVASEMSRELTARRSALLAEKRSLQSAAQRILEIDETVELLDRELKGLDERVAKAAAALQAAEVANAKPAA